MKSLKLVVYKNSIKKLKKNFKLKGNVRIKLNFDVPKKKLILRKF